MKKTLTTLTLSSIAAVAVANPIPQNEHSSLANVNINLPTGGAKPLAKIETSPSASADKESDKNKKKNQELDILPLPSQSSSSAVSSEENKTPVKLEKATTPSNISSNISPNNGVNKDKTSKEKNTVIENKVVSPTNTTKDTKKENNVSSVNNVNSAKTENKNTVNKNSDKTVKPENKETNINQDVKDKIATEQKTEKKKNENLNVSKEKSLTKEGTNNVNSNTPVSSTLATVKNPVVSKTVSPETKDVKTEITLDKKEIINNVQTVEKVVPVASPDNSQISTVEENKTNTVSENKDKIQKDKEVILNVPKKTPEQNKLKEKKQISNKNIKKKSSEKRVNVSSRLPIKSVAPKYPSPALKDIALTKTSAPYVISNKDVNVDVLYNSISKEYLVKFENKNGNNFRTSDFANVLYAEGKSSADTPLLFTLVNSKLDKVEIIKSSINADGEYLFKLPQSEGKCEAFYVTYKLASDTASSTKSIILDSTGIPTANMDRQCAVPNTTLKEDVTYTKNKYIVATTWNNVEINTNKPVSFSTLISKEGEDILKSSLRYVIISEDFSNFYYSVGNSNKSIILGTVFSQPIPSSGLHYFTAIFDNDNGELELSTSKKYINK